MRIKLIYSVILSLVFVLGSHKAIAQAEYEKYVKSETPDSSLLKMADEVLALEFDDAEKATKLIEELYKKVQKKPYQMVGLSNYFLQKKSILWAKMTAERAYNLFPEDPSVIIQRGDIYRCLRAYGKATQLYDEALSKDPENLYAMTMAAYLYKEAKMERLLGVEAKYPGNWIQYLQSHLKYPAIAKKPEVQGIVRIEFVVGKDGSISQMKVLKSLSKECDAEAMRVIRNSRWTPGKDEHGNAITSIKVQEVQFNLYY